MDWRDEGILLWVRRHGESSAIIDALTPSRGRHAGLVRGGAGKSRSAVLQPGAQLSLDWHARLADHLGTYRVELVRARAAAIMASREALAALNVVSALLVRLLPEREPNADVYRATLGLVDALADGSPDWPARYALWELALLKALGFGLDLESCAATGVQDELVYISPRSGQAVSRGAGAAYADRMLPLPQFLLRGGPAPLPEIRDSLRLTGWFLENRVRPAFELAELPAARTRLLRLLDEMQTAGAPPPPATAGLALAGE
jgi:DNA repair protein RecO (recombination protein O)